MYQYTLLPAANRAAGVAGGPEREGEGTQSKESLLPVHRQCPGSRLQPIRVSSTPRSL
jgi:hypothetical protein